MDNKLYQTLVEQFSMYDSIDLQDILNDKESSEEAIQAAQYILSGKSVEAKNYKSQQVKQNKLLQERKDKTISDPSYDDIHQMTGDIRFIRNIIIIGIVFEFINVVISFL